MTSARVLIIEDEGILALDLQDIVRQMGHETTGIADSAEEALRLAKEKPPDLVLVDIKLRGKCDGIEAARMILDLMDCAVVYLTALSESDHFERSKKTQPYAFLSKPISVRELERTVEMALYKYEADMRLKESEQRYRTLVEESFDGIFVQQGGRIVFTNPRLREMLGYEADELKDKDYRIMCNPDLDDSTPPDFFLEQCCAAGSNRYEVLLVKKDGAVFDAEIRAKETTLHGMPGVQVWVRDISAQKRAEEELKAGERRFRELVEHLPEPIFEFDISGIFTYANESGFEKFGYKKEDLELKKSCLELIIPEDRNRAILNMQKVMGGDRINSSQYTAVRKDGSTFPIIIRSAPIIRGGKIVGVRGIVTEIDYGALT